MPPNLRSSATRDPEISGPKSSTVRKVVTESSVGITRATQPIDPGDDLRSGATRARVRSEQVRFVSAPLEGPEGLTSFVLANFVSATCSRFDGFEPNATEHPWTKSVSELISKAGRLSGLGLTMKCRKAYQLLNDRSWRIVLKNYPVEAEGVR